MTLQAVEFPPLTPHETVNEAVRSGRIEDGRIVAADGTLLYRAWRVGPRSWAWRTPVMAAPAFEPMGRP